MAVSLPLLPPPGRMRAYLQQVATGPELSKSLSREAAADAMGMILRDEIDPVQAGIYLIALRMKRETDDENLGSLDALLAARAESECAVACDELVDIADPFNGFVRGLPAAPFLAPVLAACGLNAYCHGLRAVGPKYGITPHRVLAAAGVAVDLPAAEAAARIADPRIGWAYLDQSAYCPGLHRLVELRGRMVKRTCITTLEVALGPLRARARGKTHLLTGYVHKAYPPVYCQLARAAGYHGAAIVRGVEGGCVPSLTQPARFFQYHAADADGDTDDGADTDDDAPREVRVTPEQAGIDQPARMIPVPPRLLRETPIQVNPDSAEAGMGIVAPLDVEAASAYCAELGAQALAGEAGEAGEAGAMRDSLIYGGAIALLHCGRVTDLRGGADRVREALDTGAALARFEAGR